MENSTTILAGGMELSITGCNIQFTIGEFKHITTVGKLEDMLASHGKLIAACKSALPLLEKEYDHRSPTIVLLKDALRYAE
jgi:hypothetical protein